VRGSSKKRPGPFASARARSAEVLGINERNLGYVYTHNMRSDFRMADDKLVTKELLERIGVPAPETFFVYGHFFEIGGLAEDLSGRDSFVIKPARGRAGGGIVVITGRDGDGFIDINGETLSADDLRRHISDIVFGVHSFDLHDRAIVEARVEQHPAMRALSPAGLADVRVIFCRNVAVMAMTRIPTRASGGRANLHRGAVGAGIDMETGLTVHAVGPSGEITGHPDTGMDLTGVAIPCWEQVVEVGRKVACEVPLKYLGVDIVVTPQGPAVLEINVRPGLQIQSANQSGLRGLLGAIERPVVRARGGGE